MTKQADTLQRKTIAVVAMGRNTNMSIEHKTCTCNNNTAHKHQVIKNPPKKKTISRYVDLIKVLMPAVVFTVIPKCPVCLAGYIALSTGIGLSVTTATYVRITLIVLCILSLSYFIIKHMRRWMMHSN